MNKLVTFFLVMFIGCSILSAIVEGGGGMLAVKLTDPIDADDVSCNVTTTANFLSQDYVIIDDETILYSGKTATSFTGLTRGSQGTTPAVHADNATLYSMEASALNHALNFNVAAMTDSMGALAFIAIPISFFTKTIPHLIAWNWSFLTGDMMILGLFFFATGAAFIITLALSVLGARRV